MSYKEDLKEYIKYVKLNKQTNILEKKIEILEKKYLKEIKKYVISLTNNDFIDNNEIEKRIPFDYDIYYGKAKNIILNKWINYNNLWTVDIDIECDDDDLFCLSELGLEIIMKVHKLIIKNRKEKLEKILNYE